MGVKGTKQRPSDDRLAGKDRHIYGHEMTPVGPPVSLPGLERGQDLVVAGLIVGRACRFPLTGLPT